MAINRKGPTSQIEEDLHKLIQKHGEGDFQSILSKFGFVKKNHESYANTEIEKNIESSETKEISVLEAKEKFLKDPNFLLHSPLTQESYKSELNQFLDFCGISESGQELGASTLLIQDAIKPEFLKSYVD